MKTFCLAVALAAGTTLVAQQTPEPAGYQRVLVPIYVERDRPGAFGSVWHTELTIRNASSEPAQIFQTRCAYFCTCAIVGTCAGGRPVGAGSLFTDFATLAPAPNAPWGGIFVYVPKRLAAEQHFNLRVSDLSRASASAGVEIPVVREDQALQATAELLNVPTDPRFRLLLRIYAFTASAPAATVRVRILPLDGATALDDRIATLELPSYEDSSLAPGDYPSAPAYLQLPIVPDALPGEKLRIEVVPLSPGLRFWAFVTITNNATQELTIVTPQ